MSTDTEAAHPETPVTRPRKGGLIIGLGMIVLLVLLVVLNMG